MSLRISLRKRAKSNSFVGIITFSIIIIIVIIWHLCHTKCNPKLYDSSVPWWQLCGILWVKLFGYLLLLSHQLYCDAVCDVLPNKPFKDENPKIIYIDISKRPISNLSLSFNYVIYFILFFVDAFTWWRICATTITTTSGLLRVWCVCLSTH